MTAILLSRRFAASIWQLEARYWIYCMSVLASNFHNDHQSNIPESLCKWR